MKLPLAVVCLLLGLQQVPPRPAFKSGVTLVEVDVVVSDRSGRPARGLSREDFTVAEDAYRLVVETSLGSDQVSREVVFRVSSR